MKEDKIDRRVKYTVAMLKEALVQSLLKEHISKISVKSLCDLADVNRSTFYAHFNDQYDLLHFIEQEVIDNVKKHLEKQDFNDKRPVSFQVLNRILEYVKENADLFRALLSDHCDPGIQMEIMNFAQIISMQLNKKYDKRVRDYLMVFGTTGCINLLQKWLQDGMIESTTKISEIILQVVYHGTTSFE
jgi:AcrR family transcriptional regulator